MQSICYNINYKYTKDFKKCIYNSKESAVMTYISGRVQGYLGTLINMRNKRNEEFVIIAKL